MIAQRAAKLVQPGVSLVRLVIMRNLDWDGLYNVRDLGGLGAFRRAAVVRAEQPVRLSPARWQALRDYGVRRVQRPLDDHSDTDRDIAADYALSGVRVPGWLSRTAVPAGCPRGRAGGRCAGSGPTRGGRWVG